MSICFTHAHGRTYVGIADGRRPVLGGEGGPEKGIRRIMQRVVQLLCAQRRVATLAVPPHDCHQGGFDQAASVPTTTPDRVCHAPCVKNVRRSHYILALVKRWVVNKLRVKAERDTSS